MVQFLILCNFIFVTIRTVFRTSFGAGHLVEAPGDLKGHESLVGNRAHARQVLL